MKLVYLLLWPLITSVFTNDISLFGLVPVYVSVEILYFHQVLEQNITN